MVPLTSLERDRARKIAAMLSASTDGERLNALELLTRLAAEKRVRVDELLLALGEGAAAGAAGTAGAGRPDGLRARLDALRAIPDAHLTAWEQEFRASIVGQARRQSWKPSEKQTAIIESILEGR